MELSMSLNYLRYHRDKTPRAFSEAARIFADAGFRYADYTPDFVSDGWEDNARRSREILDSCGITVEQTHAPFNRYRSYPEDMFFEYYRRLFEAAKIIGARYVVVHADEYRTCDRYDPAEILDYTYDYLAPFVEFSEKNGLVVAVENLFEDHCRWKEIDGKSRFTSRVEELTGIIERFNTPGVMCCWDFGHAKCACGDAMTDALKKAGKYVVCTHVHDNYYDKDLHLLPFLGSCDWEANMRCLREAGYRGKLSFEFAYGCLPDELLPVWLKTVYYTGEYLVKLFEND
ncbi:MAG: sugar phosphate isomerase/epimerase [Clostridia bacterium]|nr:sugar phosphate isomerase/epimerase [Clostridia bacterium]